MCHRCTKACIPTDKQSMSSICGQEATAFFTSASVAANSLPTKCFLKGGPKRQTSLGPILLTWVWRQCDWQVTGHPPYRPIFKPYDFLLCGFLKKHLAGKRFSTDADVKQSVTWLKIFDSGFCYAGIQILMPRCDKYLQDNGDNVEVWCVPSATSVPCVHRS
jgi:hypothetical protein